MAKYTISQFLMASFEDHNDEFEDAEDEGVVQDDLDVSTSSNLEDNDFCHDSGRRNSDADGSSVCCDESGFNSCASDDGCSSNCSCSIHRNQTSHRVFPDSTETLLHSQRSLSSMLGEQDIDCGDSSESKSEHHKGRSECASTSRKVRVRRTIKSDQDFPERPSSTCSSKDAAEAEDSKPLRRKRRIVKRDHIHTEKNLHSYLANPPFKMQDCFQDNGFLSFIICIIYTLFLMSVFTILGIFFTCCKSLMHKDDIQNIKKNMIDSRHKRTAGTYK